MKMTEEKAPFGRPVIYDDPSKFQQVAGAYFHACDTSEPPKRPTVNGLGIALGMTRETLLRYEEKPDFSDAVKFVRMRLEDAWEQGLAGPNATGTIFWLKNQGWSDRTETALTGANGGPVETVTVINLVAGNG